MLRRTQRFSRQISAKIPKDRRSALLIALLIAIVWWGIALLFRTTKLIPIWYDQETTFTQVGAYLSDPYAVKGFVNPPWTAVLLLPLRLLPVPMAVLVQLCVYFCLIVLIVFRFGGDTRAVLIALVSFIGMDSALELNLDWLVCIGILVPAAFSGIFLLVKPQNAMGYWLSFKRREFIQALIVVLALLAVSLIVWGWWPAKMWAAIQANSLGKFYNLAPSALINNLFGWNVFINPLSVMIGLWLSWVAFKRRDPILAILAWIFFAPYLTTYALLLHFALLSIRYPRMGLLLNVVTWVVYGVTITAGLLVVMSKGG